MCIRDRFLTERGIVSKAARDNSLPRPHREIVQAFQREHPSVAPAELKAGREDIEVREFESTIRAYLDNPCSENYGMLHPGDPIVLKVSDDSYAHAYFCLSLIHI